MKTLVAEDARVFARRISSFFVVHNRMRNSRMNGVLARGPTILAWSSFPNQDTRSDENHNWLFFELLSLRTYLCVSSDNCEWYQPSSFLLWGEREGWCRIVRHHQPLFAYSRYNLVFVFLPYSRVYHTQWADYDEWTDRVTAFSNCHRIVFPIDIYLDNEVHVWYLTCSVLWWAMHHASSTADQHDLRILWCFHPALLFFSLDKNTRLSRSTFRLRSCRSYNNTFPRRWLLRSTLNSRKIWNAKWEKSHCYCQEGFNIEERSSKTSIACSVYVFIEI